MKISLPHNLTQAQTVEDVKSQMAEVIRILEDALNRQTTIYYRDDPKKPFPKFQKGDLFFDITVKKGILTLYEFDGKNLIPLTFGSISGAFDFDTIEFTGKLDLIAYGKGSGADADMYMKSDGAGGWMLAPVPDPIVLVPLSNGMLPNPELLFDGVTGDVLMHPA